MQGKDWLLISIVAALFAAAAFAYFGKWFAFAYAVISAHAAYGWRYARSQPERAD